ncbi:MAG: hypothetical protein C5B54_07805 [Acidobacteria bacterium]|nr:MAG: hypothetical protein C5B54_07805 [Acidobacteriota bacterium]
MNRPFVIGIVLFIVVLAGLLFLLKHKPKPPQVQNHNESAATAAPAQKTEEGQTQRRINVKLFFSNGNSTQLLPEERSVQYQDTLLTQAKEVLNELIKGPTGDLQSTIPDKTQLKDLFITKDGVAYADFSQELAGGMPGGSTAEMNTVFSIVNTLTLNFPQIKRVQILVNDQAVETLSGHVDLSHPLHQDLSLVPQTSEPASPQTNQTQPS